MAVFLSYTKEDAALAARLSEDLKRAGIEVWSAKTAIEPGADWVSEIDQAISEASDLLFIVPSHRGLWQASEISLAVASKQVDPNKRIVPILVRPAEEIPFFLRRYQALDLKQA